MGSYRPLLTSETHLQSDRWIQLNKCLLNTVNKTSARLWKPGVWR